MLIHSTLSQTSEKLGTRVHAMKVIIECKNFVCPLLHESLLLTKFLLKEQQPKAQWILQANQ